MLKRFGDKPQSEFDPLLPLFAILITGKRHMEDASNGEEGNGVRVIEIGRRKELFPFHPSSRHSNPHDAVSSHQGQALAFFPGANPV